MTKSTNSGWFRVAATLVASACAAALAIAILLPKNSEREIARDDSQFKKPRQVTDTIVIGDIHNDTVLVDSSGSMGPVKKSLNELGRSKMETERDVQMRIAANQPAKSGQTVEEFTFSGSKSSEAGTSSSAGGQDPNNQRLRGWVNGETRSKPNPQPNNGITFEANLPLVVDSYAVPAGGGIAISGPAPTDPAQKNPAQQQENKQGRLYGVGAASSAAPSPTGAPGQAQPNNPQQNNARWAKPEIAYTITKPANESPAPTPNGVRQSLQPGDVVDTRNIRPDVTALKRSQLFKNDPAAPTTATPLATILNPEPRPTLALGLEGRGLNREDEIRAKEFDSLHRLHDHPANHGGEQYEQRVENIFQGVRIEPLSTFSIDVDTASYTNCRRFLDGRQLPPTAAVRVEEFINYFRYDYPQPTGKDPFSVNMEMADCPWTPNHKLLRIGLKGKEIDRRERPESNLVFLVDVSGSMSSEDKLPLLRDALHRWVNELTANDRVTIVTYAGDAGLRLPTTRGDQKDKLHAAIETLQSGGSTHGSAGIKLAYEEATKNFLENGGVNRVLWATDGDLNVGTTGDDELVELITNKAKTGVFLTVLGVGTGNLKDAKLEKMADKGNGVYAYLDSPKEARKVLIEQMSGTTITIAKDVKIQIEFNPAEIAGYRLIGYENRMLAAEDFANDKKDAGEIGAGHTVTALYEIIPVGAEEVKAAPAGEPLKYQAATATAGSNTAEVKLSDAAKSGELLNLKLRFKQPDGHKSELREFPLKERGGKFTAASRDFQFAGCVAQLAMILRDSQYRGQMTTAAIAEIAAATKGEDKDGSRAEFVELVKRVQELGK